MTDLERLKTAVIENPFDDTIRAIYADCLEEERKAEAQFFRSWNPNTHTMSGHYWQLHNKQVFYMYPKTQELVRIIALDLYSSYQQYKELADELQVNCIKVRPNDFTYLQCMGYPFVHIYHNGFTGIVEWIHIYECEKLKDNEENDW